ncbi:MAG: hypothetical protein QW578_05755 [Thermoplasmatales archaeon]
MAEENKRNIGPLQNEHSDMCHQLRNRLQQEHKEIEDYADLAGRIGELSNKFYDSGADEKARDLILSGALMDEISAHKEVIAKKLWFIYVLNDC